MSFNTKKKTLLKYAIKKKRNAFRKKFFFHQSQKRRPTAMRKERSLSSTLAVVGRTTQRTVPTRSTVPTPFIILHDENHIRIKKVILAFGFAI